MGESTSSSCIASASASSNSAPRRKRGSVRFSDVQVLVHEVQLDESKLPSDGAAPLGLGTLQSREDLPIDQYELQKGSPCRDAAVIPPAERHAALLATECLASLERVERANCALKREMNDSLREHVQSVVAAGSVLQLGSKGVDGVIPVGVKLVREMRRKQVAQAAPSAS